MQIFIKALVGRTVTLDVEPSDSIGKVKGNLHEVDDFFRYYQLIIIYNGKRLVDDKTLSGYEI